MNYSNNRIPELLAPAGNFEKMVGAIHYGADAVYLGGLNFSLRSRAGNFDNDALGKAVLYAHNMGVRVFVTINVFARNIDLDKLDEYLIFLRNIKVDGLIITDPGILFIARKLVPEISLHLSTQANVTNYASVEFWSAQGVSRVNLARELSLNEISTIRAKTTTRLEVFVHGALCISYSGRCMLSTYMTGRDANQGDCAHPCRYSYSLMEKKRENQYFPVEEDSQGTYIFNSKDLCLLKRLPELVDVGVDSIKIEGRMKSVGYVSSIVRIYRAALDWIEEQRKMKVPLEKQILPDRFHQEIIKTGTRGWTENFIDGPPDAADMMHDTMRLGQPWAPVGIIRGQEPLFIEVRNVLKCGDLIEYLGKNMETVPVRVELMTLENGKHVERANPGNTVFIKTEPPVKDPETHGIFRKNMEI